MWTWTLIRLHWIRHVHIVMVMLLYRHLRCVYASLESMCFQVNALSLLLIWLLWHYHTRIQLSLAGAITAPSSSRVAASERMSAGNSKRLGGDWDKSSGTFTTFIDQSGNTHRLSVFNCSSFLDEYKIPQSPTHGHINTQQDPSSLQSVVILNILHN